jgi:hypothetical protein
MQAYHQYGVGLRGFVDLKKWCTRLAAVNTDADFPLPISQLLMVCFLVL